MSDGERLPTQSRKAVSWRTASILGATALLCSTALVVTHTMTEPEINRQQENYLQRQLSEVLPSRLYNNNLSTDTAILISSALGSDAGQTAWRARMDDEPVAAILTVTAPGGYAGPITLLLGVLTNGEVTGARVISHRETPGLGDGIEVERSDWIRKFEQHSLTSLTETQWQVKKDGGVFDHFTGATITPRAVTSAIYRALEYFELNQEQIFATKQ